MTYPLLTLDESLTPHSALFIEGLVLAANMATQPLAPHTWLPSVFDQQAEAVSAALEGQINQQYHCLKCNDYSLLDLVDEAQIEAQLSEVAQGFMTLWPMIEPQWSQASVSDGTLRMLQALLTTFMLAIDPLQTEQQMQDAGIATPPTLAQMYPQLDLMISDVAQAADELMLGAKAQNINPYKNIGRNDPCPCGSGSKFKQCCGA